MLSRELMGVLALWILWVNTLLIVAATVKHVAAVRRWAAALRPLAPGQTGLGLVQGRAQGVLGRYELQQIGRAGAGRGAARTIHYADRAYGGDILDGTLATADGPVRLSAGEGEVWPSAAALSAAALRTNQTQFEAAYEEARRARGYARTVCIELGGEQPLYAAGEVRGSAGGRVLLPARELRERVLLSATDPRRWVLFRTALAVGFILAMLLAACIITALSLYPPVFGRVSTAGALAGLGFFLGIQPLGNAVRDALLPPSRAPVRGICIEPTPVQSTPGRRTAQRVPAAP